MIWLILIIAAVILLGTSDQLLNKKNRHVTLNTFLSAIILIPSGLISLLLLMRFIAWLAGFSSAVVMSIAGISMTPVVLVFIVSLLFLLIKKNRKP